MGNYSGPGLGIEALNISGFAHIQCGITEDLDEVTVGGYVSGNLAVCAEGGDEGGQYHGAALQEQFGEFTDTADVLFAIVIGKAEVGAEPVAHVIAIQHEGAGAEVIESILQGVGQGGFARAGEAGEPDHGALVPVLLLAQVTGDGGLVPNNVAAFGRAHSY